VAPVADVALKPVDGEVQAAPSQCPLLGVKRTSACALHMSAFDPKRTLGDGPSHTSLGSYGALS
ncbi:MAG: hypothetical protein WBE96_24370, partial [Pseudolabrys sp.]